MRIARTCLMAALATVGALVLGCTSGDEGRGSLGEALGFGDPDDLAGVYEVRSEWTRQVEELTAACMAEQGFDYIPVDIAPDPRAGGELTAAEYRARYGYGMLSSWEASLLEVEGWVDPNEQIRTSLDEPTMLAWQTALHGENPLDPDTRDGCRAEAEDEINAYLFTDVWAELEPLLDDLEARIAADPRTVEAEANWTGCMAAAGYPFAGVDDAITAISEAAMDAWVEEPHPETGMVSTVRYNLKAWFVETDTWAELIELELDIAAHDQACREDPEVRAEYEQRFLDDHADLLEQLQQVR